MTYAWPSTEVVWRSPSPDAVCPVMGKAAPGRALSKLVKIDPFGLGPFRLSKELGYAASPGRSSKGRSIAVRLGVERPDASADLAIGPDRLTTMPETAFSASAA